MNLNPYQNNLLSSYLEKSAAKPLRIRRPNGGNGGTLVARGNPKLGVRPISVNPNKAPKPPVPPTRNTALAPIDSYPLARRYTPSIDNKTLARMYRDMAGTGSRLLDPRFVHEYLGNNMHKLDDGIMFDGVYYAGKKDISFNKPKGSVIDAEVVGGGSGKPPVPPTSSVTAGIPGGSNKGPGIPGGKDGRPWYKNPWIIGGGAAGTLGAGGAALYNYASNAAKETTDAAPTPGGAPDNNSNNNTPTPNEAPESEGWWDSILEWVQENPELAMLILAGGGFAGGALLAR